MNDAERVRIITRIDELVEASEKLFEAGDAQGDPKVIERAHRCKAIAYSLGAMLAPIRRRRPVSEDPETLEEIDDATAEAELRKHLGEEGMRELARLEKASRARHVKVIAAKNRLADAIADTRNTLDEIEKTAGWDPDAAEQEAERLSTLAIRVGKWIGKLNAL